MVFLVMYGWVMFAPEVPAVLESVVSDMTALLAAITLIMSSISYFFMPKSHKLWFGYTVYLLSAVMLASLVYTTGGDKSAFVALWMLISLFAGLFGYLGFIPVGGAVLLYSIVALKSGSFDDQVGLSLFFVGLLPLVISYIAWHRTPHHGRSTTPGIAVRTGRSPLDQPDLAAKSAAAIESISDGIIVIDGKGVIELINPAAQTIVGWDKGDALKLHYKSVLKLTDKNDAPLTPANDPIEQALHSHELTTNDDVTLRTTTNQKIIASVTASPAGKEGSGIVIVFRDITTQRKAEREQSEFISTASHEMRTPVASIEGYLGLALNPATAQIDDKARSFIEKAHTSVKHLGSLFQDLLEITRADDGRLKSDPEVIDVVEFSEEIIDGLRHLADEKSLSIEFKPRPQAATIRQSRQLGRSDKVLTPAFFVHVDKNHLREVIANLIENAIKYTLQGSIAIDVQGDHGKAIISVKDSGVGIPKNDIAHLFQKFYRVDNSDTREIGGTGLGLYLVRKLVETMSGRIWVQSEEGEGSTFFVELPRLSREQTEQLKNQQEFIKSQAAFSQTPTTDTPTATPATPTPPQPSNVTSQPPVPTPAPQPAAPAPLQPTPTPPEQPVAPSAQNPHPATPPVTPQPAVTQSIPGIETITPVMSPQPAPQPQSVQQAPVHGPSLAEIEANPSQYRHTMTRPDNVANK